MRVSAHWVLALAFCSAGLLGEDVQSVSSSDTFRFGTTFQFTLEKAATFQVPFCPGSSILYQITLTNLSSQGTGDLVAFLADPIPKGTTYVAGSASNGAVFETEQNRVTWTGVLGGQEFPRSHTISFLAKVNQATADGTVVTNVASARVFLPNQAFLDRQVELPLTVNCFPSTGQVTWTGAGSGNFFSNPANWNPPVVPGPGHDAVIPVNSGEIIVSQPHQLGSLALGTGSTLVVNVGLLALGNDSTVDGLLVIGFAQASSRASTTQSEVSGMLTVQGDISGTGKITNFGHLILSSADLNVELETDGIVEIDGLVNLTQPSENRGSYSLNAGDSLHYQASGHDLATMTLNGRPYCRCGRLLSTGHDSGGSN